MLYNVLRSSSPSTICRTANLQPSLAATSWSTVCKLPPRSLAVLYTQCRCSSKTNCTEAMLFSLHLPLPPPTRLLLHNATLYNTARHCGVYNYNAVTPHQGLHLQDKCFDSYFIQTPNSTLFFWSIFIRRIDTLAFSCNFRAVQKPVQTATHFCTHSFMILLCNCYILLHTFVHHTLVQSPRTHFT